MCCIGLVFFCKLGSVLSWRQGKLILSITNLISFRVTSLVWIIVHKASWKLLEEIVKQIRKKCLPEKAHNNNQFGAGKTHTVKIKLVLNLSMLSIKMYLLYKPNGCKWHNVINCFHDIENLYTCSFHRGSIHWTVPTL